MERALHAITRVAGKGVVQPYDEITKPYRPVRKFDIFSGRMRKRYELDPLTIEHRMAVRLLGDADPTTELFVADLPASPIAAVRVIVTADPSLPLAVREAGFSSPEAE